jgi:hypothetical protein
MILATIKGAILEAGTVLHRIVGTITVVYSQDEGYIERPQGEGTRVGQPSLQGDVRAYCTSRCHGAGLEVRRRGDRAH